MILKRLLLYPLLIVFIVLYLALAVIFVPGVPALALKLGKGFIPDTVQIGEISGALSGPLTVQQITYRDNETFVSLDRVVIEWKPSCLLRTQMCIDTVQLDGLSLQLPETESEPQTRTEPFVLPELQNIKLPFTFELQKFQLNRLEVAVGEQKFNLETVELSAAYSDAFSIESLRIQQGNTWIEWQAHVRPMDDYDLSSNLNWFIELTDIEEIVNQSLAFPLNSPISGGLTLNGNAKDLKISFDNQLSTEITGPVELTLSSRVAPYDEAFSLENLHIRLNDTLAEISLKGSLENWLEPRLDFALDWVQVGYPILDDAEPKLVTVPQGKLTLQGLLTDYQVTLETALYGQDIPDVAIHFQGSGDLESLQQLKLNMALLGGEVDVEGSLNWSEQLAWNTRVWVRNLNPGQFNSELEGNVNLELLTRGQLNESGPDVYAELIALTGEFRDQSLRGQGQVNYRLDAINIDSLMLGLGATQIDLNGSMLNEQLALNFNLNAPDLASILPDLAGQLSASGQVNGPLLTPEIQAELAGSALRFQTHEVEQLEGQIQADLSGSKQSTIDLSLLNINVAGESQDNLLLKVNGKPESHRIQLTTSGELINLNALINGQFDSAQTAYRGRLSELEIDRDDIGRWVQNNASAFNFQAPSFRLEQTCLIQTAGDAALCIAANRNASDRISAEFSLADLSLRLLDPYLEGNKIESALNISGQFSQQGSQNPTAQINISTTAGRLITPPDQPDFDLDPIRLDAALSGDQLTAELSALFSEMDGQITANVNVQQLSSQQRLEGDLDITLNDLAMISVFVPDIQALEGQLYGRFLMRGTLSAPVVTGSLDFKDGGADIPAQGIRISPLNVSIQAGGDEGESMSLQGLIGSGNGEIRLNGTFNLATFEGELSIQGEDFEAMATEINLLVSPDISIRVDDAIRVGGSVTIPYAHITPPRQQAQNAIRASDDVVFIDDEGLGITERNLPLLTDIQLILGDSVVVNAFGFNGRLLGRLRVQDDGLTATRASGSIQVESGDYRLFGQDMTIQRGSLIFSGGPIDNPGLDLRVSRTVDTVVAGARIVGTLLNPEFSLFSTPAMPDSSIMSYLVLGRGPGESSASEQSMMLQAAMALSMQGGSSITGQLREELSLDEFGFASDDSGDSAFFIGKYLTPRLYIRYGVSLLESVEVLTLSYRLSSMWKVETQSSSVGSGADFFYTRER